MAAFVPGVGAHVGSAVTSFKGNVVCGPPAQAASGPTMRVLDGLDTVTQQPYSFSRYILGPFQGITLSPVSGDGEREVAMNACYRHVFGNAYVMEEERAELAIADSQFKLGALSVKEFVRTLAKSYAYRSRFLEGASNYRFIELNFMHLLGRAPDSYPEMKEHNDRFIAKGFDAEIDSHIDSDEYDSCFGEDTVPFLRFRGAYTPCDSFNKQCALKGGWANSDKAMGGAALSGYNGSDGRQMSTLIANYMSGATTPYESVAENSPLKSTSPNWYACPDPAVAPTPAFISEAEVSAAQERVAALQKLYDQELARKNAPGAKDPLSPFRAMVRELGTGDRGFAYSGGDPLLANPYAKLMDADESALAEVGYKSSDYQRYGASMENDSLSRIERDLEVAKGDLRTLSKALAMSSPVTPEVALPGQITTTAGLVEEVKSTARPVIKGKPRARPAPVEAKKISLPLGISIPNPFATKISSPIGISIPNPFAKKE